MIDNNEIKVKKESFINSAKNIYKIFKNEGIFLNFENYKNTINQYVSCDEINIEVLTLLIRDLNLWSAYFGSLEALSTNIYLKYENKKLYLEGFPKTMNNLKVIDELNLSIKKIKLFLKHIKIQKKMFSNFYIHCLELYNASNESICFRYNDDYI